MIMVNLFLTTTLLLGSCIPGTIRTENLTAGPLFEFGITPGQHLGTTDLAQNDSKKPSDNVSTDNNVKRHNDTDKPKTSTPNETAPKAVKPVKPFVPSETIPADQGVDFPYDI